MSEPVFEFSGSNPFGMSSLSNLADIDHDGDLDVLPETFPATHDFSRIPVRQPILLLPPPSTTRLV